MPAAKRLLSAIDELDRALIEGQEEIQTLRDAALDALEMLREALR